MDAYVTTKYRPRVTSVTSPRNTRAMASVQQVYSILASVAYYCVAPSYNELRRAFTMTYYPIHFQQHHGSDSAYDALS
jgi:hypothetical protein